MNVWGPVEVGKFIDDMKKYVINLHKSLSCTWYNYFNGKMFYVSFYVSLIQDIKLIK